MPNWRYSFSTSSSLLVPEFIQSEQNATQRDHNGNWSLAWKDLNYILVNGKKLHVFNVKTHDAPESREKPRDMKKRHV